MGRDFTARFGIRHSRLFPFDAHRGARAGIGAVKPPVPVRRLSDLLRRANQIYAAQYQTREPGLTLAQTTVMRALLEFGPMTGVALTAITAVDRSTLSTMITTLRDARLLVAVRHEGDSRANMVSLTPAGQHALEKADAADRETERWLLRQLTKTSRAVIARTLSEVAALP